MPTICISRPNRTKKRTFTSCDVARIAREVVRDEPEATPEEVMACIAKGFGFTHVSLSRQRAVEGNVILTKAVPLLITLLKIIEKAAKASRRFKILLGPILAIVKKVLDIIESADMFDPPQKKVDDVISPGRCRCKDRFIQPENEVMKNAS
jgi:hypothetical protein